MGSTFIRSLRSRSSTRLLRGRCRCRLPPGGGRQGGAPPPAWSPAVSCAPPRSDQRGPRSSIIALSSFQWKGTIPQRHQPHQPDQEWDPDPDRGRCAPRPDRNNPKSKAAAPRARITTAIRWTTPLPHGPALEGQVQPVSPSFPASQPQKLTQHRQPRLQREVVEGKTSRIQHRPMAKTRK